MRSLLAVAETGTITAAAQRLGLTQPALSRRIQQLEEDLDTKLLVRGRKGATLTDSGALAEQEARVLVARYEGLRTRISNLQGLDTGTVRLGGGATAIEFLVPPAIAQFQRQHPGIRFQVKEAGSREIEQDVINGTLELGLVTQPVLHGPELHTQSLFSDRIVLVAHVSHPLASRDSVAVEELASLTLVGFEGGSAIRKIVDDALRRMAVQMNVVMELRSIPAILRMVATTGSLAFVSRLGTELQPDIREIPVSDLAVERELALVSRRGTELSAAARAFANKLLAAS
ncbi:MAG: LysR substrate-binding domain-containing protein [Pseudomonadota bacterium]